MPVLILVVSLLCGMHCTHR